METQLRQLAAQLDRIAREAPDMTGLDFAAERGWVSPAEHEEADNAARLQQEKEHAVLEEIRRLAASEPERFDPLFDGVLRRLGELHDRLLPHAADFEVQCVCNLLPSLKTTLQQWRAGEKPNHSPAWAWRFVFAKLDEAAALAAHLK